MTSAEDRAANEATKVRNIATDQATNATNRAVDQAAKIANDAADHISRAANKAKDDATKAANRAADEVTRAANQAKDKAAKAVNDAADQRARAANKLRDAAAKDMEALHGIWVATGRESGGQRLANDVWEKDAIEFFRFDAECVLSTQGRKDRASFTLHPEQTPRAIDFRWTTGPARGKTTLAIYEMEGGTLKLGDGGGADAPRPSAFKTEPGSPSVVHVFQRPMPPLHI